MQESLSPEHGPELIPYPGEQLLYRGVVPDESSGHLQPSGGNVAHSCLHVVGDPLYKVSRVLCLHLQHLLIHLRGRGYQ